MRKKVPFVSVLVVMLLFVFLSIEPPTMLFSASFLYLLSGPVISLFRWNRKRQRIREPASKNESDETG
jgi:CDP-diacylglycerol--serine O-phosphatidyltransferase